MIIQCPACNAQYAVPDHAIGADGRQVRCAKCTHQWLVKRPPSAMSVEELDSLLKVPEKPVAKPIPAGSNLPAKTKPAFSPLLTGAVAASFIFAIICNLLIFIPGMFGITHTKDIAFADLKLAKQETKTGMEYGISGKIINLADKPQTMPAIRIMLIDKEGTPLKSWSPGGVATLAPKESKDFNFAPLSTSLSGGDRLVLDMGNSTELALRSRP